MGAAYVFVRTRSDREGQQKLVDPEPASTSALGSAVAVLGDTALVVNRRVGRGEGPGHAVTFLPIPDAVGRRSVRITRRLTETASGSRGDLR